MASPKIKSIKIEGFRRLEIFDFDMRPVMALIGANGVGKTSFMDALSLLAASARGSLNQHLGDLGGIASVATQGRVREIVLNVVTDNPSYEPPEYRLKLEAQGPGYGILEETLLQATPDQPLPFKHIDRQHNAIRFSNPATHRLEVPDWEFDSSESALSQVPRMYRQCEQLRRILSSATHYHALDVGKNAPVKLPQQMRPVSLPGSNGEDLFPFLYNLRELDRPKYEAVEDSLKAAFPGFEFLGFPVVSAGVISMTWKERAFNGPFFMNQLSEGTLRFLWLVSLLQSPSLPTVTMIDEPEVSLHPELLGLLADLLREASDRTQIIVATHSDRLVRFLEPHEVAVMDIDESGASAIRWGDNLDLEEWLADYSLDEVWQMGLMGGRA